jgi:cyclophilin family peptidyl-prolyl cis-trans isomerase
MQTARSWVVAALGVGFVVGSLQGLGAQAPSKPAPPKAAAKDAPAPAGLKPSPGAGPIIVMETVKGTIEFETYPDEAPKSVEQILRLIKRNFYNGQRVMRVDPGFVVQFGDPQTRDMTKRDWWGRGFAAGSGKLIGAAEFSKKRTHVRGAVAMAHAGDPTTADNQMYITLAPQPKLDGKHTVVGRVLSGMDVVAKLQVTDIIKKVYVKTATGAPQE